MTVFFKKKYLPCLTFYIAGRAGISKMPSLFPRQDALKYVSSDLAKPNLKFGPMSGLLILTHYVQVLRPYRK